MERYMESSVKLQLFSSQGNPRNSEGSFLALGDGTVLFAYSRFSGGSWHDHDGADIALIRSVDGGESWSEAEIFVSRTAECRNLMSVSFLRLKSGRIVMVYLKKIMNNGYPDGRPVCRYSDDDGATWSDWQYVVPAPGYYVLNNDRIIQLASGRIIIPCAFHRWQSSNLKIDRRAVDIVFYSDDDGVSWNESPSWILPVQNSQNALQEPGVVELADNQVMLWARTELGCQYKAFSYDGALNWSAVVPAPEFTSPCSPLSIKRNPSDGGLVAVWNSRSPRYKVVPEPESWGRTPLVIARSYDNGVTWCDHSVIENDPAHGYCYTAIHFCDDDSILISYCCGGKSRGTSVLQDLIIRKIRF